MMDDYRLNCKLKLTIYVNILCSYKVLGAFTFYGWIKIELDAEYLYYLFSTGLPYQGLGKWGTQLNLNTDTVGEIVIPIPSKSEMADVVAFIDRKTADIDQLIANKEKLIALYEEEKTAIINRAVTRGLDPDVKTKPSGIDWLGDIPEHWEVKRLKYVVSMKSGEGITSDQIKESGDYLVFGGNGLRGYFDSFTHEGNYVLIGRQGALCGSINYASEKFWASEHAIVCTLADNYEMKWLGELLKTMNLNQYSVSAAQPGLSIENIKVLLIPIPPQSEQTAIVTHIDTECFRLDTIIEKLKKQIELFKEYRTTLISDVVTGKIDVRGEVQRFTIKMVADFYEVHEITVKRYLEKFEDELKHNGYVLSRGKSLQALKLQFGSIINATTKTTVLGLFNFRAVLNPWHAFDRKRTGKTSAKQDSRHCP